MCVVIDMNVLPCVFIEQNDKHNMFKPIKSWILEGKGKMVVGGKTYFDELEKMVKIRKIYVQLRKAGKVVVIEQNSIDNLENELKKKLQHQDFDDPHIVALLIISGCQVVCSNDVRAFQFFQMNKWYPKGRSIPKIYCDRSYANRGDILNDNNIADICTPCNQLNKKQAQAIAQVAV
jgi:hypothetical protein